MHREVRISIRWRDIDNYGHVNNAVYLTYLEEARDRLVEALVGTDAWDFVLAHVGIDYRSQLTLEDREVVVRCEMSGFGRSSVRTRETITSAGGALAAEAESVIVPRDPSGSGSRPLTDSELATLQAALEG